MSSIALALKYRPTCFGDLIGQSAVSQTLSLALDSKHISHAYLFSGLRGSGKTSSARIFARALQCENGPSSQPCGECASCVEALQNKHIDIIEMDAASSRGIDDIKRLIEQTKYHPSLARYKIFIIDEVHMLSREAFNALLKTLEEPPEFVKFILATTDPLKLPPTILSRTQHFRFKQIPHKLVVEHIAHILQKEGVSYDEQALEIIARSGSGSLRDTLTILDQAIIFCKNHIEVAGVSDMLGVVDPKVLEDYFASILNKDESRLQALIQILSEYECEMILDEMMLFLKDKLLQRDAEFPTLLIDRFSAILTDSKVLLSLNTDGAFVILLCTMKMQEAMKVKDIESMIEELEAEIFGTSARPQAIRPQNTSSASHEVEIPFPKYSSDSQTLPADKPSENSAPIFSGQHKFTQLIQKLKDRSMKLGETFENHISFVEFKNGVLCWQSRVQGEDKAFLKEHFGIIRAFVGEIFGDDASIQSVQQSTESPSDSNNPSNPSHPQNPPVIPATPQQPQAQQDSLSPSHKMPTPPPPSQSHEALDQHSDEEKEQTFLAQNRELISAINESVGIKNVIPPAGSPRA